MKIRKMYLLGTWLLASTVVSAQDFSLQPQPQQIVTQNKQISLPATYLLSGEAEANTPAVNGLKALFADKQPDKSGIQIYIGEKGDKAVRKFVRQIPNHAEGYYLSVSDKAIVLAGRDERGTYYAMQTLSQLLKDNQLPVIEIKDYPAIRFRGVVEGFYGTPWSHDARLRQLRFYGENKMNTYIYGPKDDPYHSSPNWRLPYPEKEAKQLQELVKVANENEVDFVWAIHPGLDIRWNQEDRDHLISKFEKMYELGVRSFAVFFDDISGEGTDPVKQAELLNYIDESFVRVKQDVTPLVMCPTEYNKGWTKVGKGYLTTLGDKLNPSIHIMWTGDRVVSDISEEGISWINERIRRPAYIWWNFPVSDYVRDHLLLGPVYGNDMQIADRMSGFVTNPMEHAEASKIAIYGVADYAWNPTPYDYWRTWKRAMQTILPDASPELEFFAAHNSDLGINGHGYRREESVELQPTAQRFIQSYLNDGTYATADYDLMLNSFDRMVEVSNLLIASDSNAPLIKEMMPWIYQFKLLGETGREVLAMADACKSNEQELFRNKYRQVKGLQLQMFHNDQTYNQNQFQPGVKTATKVIKPFIDHVFANATVRFNGKYGTTLNVVSDYSPHKLISNVEQIKNQPLQIKTNRVLISPILEVVKWQAGNNLVIELDQVYPGQNIEIDFGQPNIADWGKLEVSADGQEWREVTYSQNKTRVTADLQKVPMKVIRFTNTGKEPQEIRLRKFIVSLDK